MFSHFDFLFGEEKSKNVDGKIFGHTESHFLQESVRASEIENKNGIFYDEDEVKIAIIHARQDIVLLVAILSRTNILLRWIRLILVAIFLVIAYRFLIF